MARRHENTVWSVCWRVLRQRQDTEDAFQATFMILMRRAAQTVWRESIDGWLHDVGYKVATKAKVARERRRAREERRAKMRHEDYDSPVSKWELSEILDKELTRIPEQYRSPLILCYLEGLTQEQAARRLGIPLRTFEWRLARGREQLSQRLAKQGMNLSTTMLGAALSPGSNIPKISPGLMEKTLEMVRIVTLSNSMWETAGISPQVAALVKAVMGLWTMKAKILIGVFLLTLVSVGGGMITYSGWMCFRGDQAREIKPISVIQVLHDVNLDKTLSLQTDSYGDPLPAGALTRLGTTRLRHNDAWYGGGEPESVLFTRDGGAIVTAGRRTPYLRIWNIDTGKLLTQFDEKPPGFRKQRKYHRSVALSPGGNRLASCVDYGVELWDVKTGKLLYSWLHKAEALVFSADGNTLQAVRKTNRDVFNIRGVYDICVWDVMTGAQMHQHELVFDAETFAFFAFAPNGNVLVSVNQKQSMVHLWDAGTGKHLHHLGTLKSEVVTGSGEAIVVFSLDSRFLAIAEHSDGDSVVHLWDVATGKEVRQLGADRVGTWSVAFSPDGKILATGSGGGPIRLWEVATGKELRSCQNYRAHIVALAFSRDGKRLASGAKGNDCTTRVWEVATGKEVGCTLGGHSAPVLSVSFAPDGRSLVSGSRDGTVRIWDTETGRERQAFLRAGDFQAPAALSADGKTIVSVGNIVKPVGTNYKDAIRNSASLIRVWDVASGQVRHQFSGKTGFFAQSVAISSDGKTIAVVYYGNSNPLKPNRFGSLHLYIWDAITSKEVFTDTFESEVIVASTAAFSPDNQVLGVGGARGVLSLRDITTGKQIFSGRQERTRSFVRCLAFSPDGQWLATAVGQEIRFWHSRLPDKEWVLDKNARITGQKNLLSTLAFSPDGKILAAAGQNGVLSLWETATGKERRHFTGHRGAIWCLAFAPDGQRLASGSNDSTTLIWDVTGHLHHGHRRRIPNPAQALESAWADLAADDAEKAGRAIETLVALEKSTVSFLKTRVRPTPPLPAKALAQLIEDLDHQVYMVRQKARQKLEALGEVAEPSLRQALTRKPSLELRRTVEQLLALVEAKGAAPCGDALRELRAIEVLEHIGTPEARHLLMELSSGESGARKTQEVRASLRRQ